MEDVGRLYLLAQDAVADYWGIGATVLGVVPPPPDTGGWGIIMSSGPPPATQQCHPAECGGNSFMRGGL